MSEEDEKGNVGKTRRAKSRSPHYQANNEGGYGNPPVRTQFKGRPGPGRPQGKTSLGSAIEKVLKGQVPLKSGGSTEYVNALAIAARDASLKKTIAATEFGFRLLERYGSKPPEEKLDLGCLSEVEIEIFFSLLMRVNRELPEPPQPNPLRIKLETGEGYFIIEKGGDGHLCIRRIAELFDEVVVKSAVDDTGEP